jgi:hypothetical protein
MSSIEITPLNISGVKLPFDLLDNLLGQNIDYTKLVYPLDLATNPQYCHAVQFSVHDYTYPVVEGAYNQISGALNTALTAATSSALGSQLPQIPSATEVGASLSNATKQVASDASQSIKSIAGIKRSDINSAIEKISNTAPGEIKQFVTNYGPLAQPGSYKPTVNDQPLAYVSLYMPDTLIADFSSNYHDASLSKTFGLAGYVGNATADVMKNMDSLKTNPSNIAQLSTIEDLKRGATAIAGGSVIGAAGGDTENATLLLQNALKRVPNPQLQLLYQGTNLREFSFEFTFTPASAKEAESVDQIVKTFAYYSLPDLTDGVGGQFLIPPQIFRIKFQFLGDNGIATQIGNVLQNTIGNLLGTQFSKIISGSNPTTDITNAKQAKVFTINDCVLRDVSVNYAPNGWASYQDGFPIQTTLSLRFSEINIVTKKSPGIAPKNTVNYELSKNADQIVGQIDKMVGPIPSNGPIQL